MSARMQSDNQTTNIYCFNSTLARRVISLNSYKTALSFRLVYLATSTTHMLWQRTVSAHVV